MPRMGCLQAASRRVELCFTIDEVLAQVGLVVHKMVVVAAGARQNMLGPGQDLLGAQLDPQLNALSVQDSGTSLKVPAVSYFCLLIEV